MAFHQLVSEDGGVGCLVCALHLDDEATVLDTSAPWSQLDALTAYNLIAQVDCRLHDGEGHHFVPVGRAIECAHCGTTVHGTTPGGITPTCLREDTPR